MNLHKPTSSNLTDTHRELFAQGADLIASTGSYLAGLWFNHTPIHGNHPIGTIGGCRLDDSADASRFLSDCASYLHQHHQCRTVVGPMNGNTWLQHRLVIESNGRDPFFMEPVEPGYFFNTFAATGFSVLSRYSSSTIDLTIPQKDYASMASRLGKNGVTFRSINPDAFAQDLTAIFDLSLISFSSNFLYTPLSKAAFVGKYMSTREHIDPDMVILAERDGGLMGYVFCMPDLIAHQLGKKPSVIIKTLAALPDRSLSGVGTVLVAKAQQIARDKGYTEAIHALQYESNSSLRISQRFKASVFRRYALMVKSFPSP
ncbi:MAG: GNAT family N-acetyltransferase [Akkermansiaceae bacterium]|nr:GNAT family N-acetyltransferase [Akkermansiaceae bacterium]